MHACYVQNGINIETKSPLLGHAVKQREEKEVEVEVGLWKIEYFDDHNLTNAHTRYIYAQHTNQMACFVFTVCVCVWFLKNCDHANHSIAVHASLLRMMTFHLDSRVHVSILVNPILWTSLTDANWCHFLMQQKIKITTKLLFEIRTHTHDIGRVSIAISTQSHWNGRINGKCIFNGKFQANC